MCLIALVFLPVLADLIIGVVAGPRGLVVRPFGWLLAMPAIKIVLILFFTIATALTAAGLAQGFAGWPRLRSARLPFSAVGSLLLPAGVTVGVFLCTEVLLVALEVYVIRTLNADLLFSFLFDALPVAALPIAAGMITYASLRDKLRSSVGTSAPPSYPVVPQSSPR